MDTTFDLATLDTAKRANEGVDITLRHPVTNAKLPLAVTILGADSDKFRKVADASMDAVFKEIAKTGKVGARSAESVREERIAAVAECIVSWSGFVRDGQALDCTDKNKVAVLSYSGFGWLLDQVDTAIRDRANFLPE